MRKVAKRTLRVYRETEPRAGQPRKARYAIASKADWSSPAEVRSFHGNASIVGNDRGVFSIGGNRYRLIVRFDNANRTGFVRFAESHAGHDASDAATVGIMQGGDSW